MRRSWSSAQPLLYLLSWEKGEETDFIW